MASPLHSKQTTADGIHSAIAYEYANASARTSATGFTSEDLNKFARQTDNDTIWMLTAVTPTWVQVMGGTNPLTTNPPENVTKSAALAGVSSESARADHKHDISTGTPVSLTDSSNAEGTATSLARSDHTHGHGSRGGGTLHSEATTSVAGFLSAADKTKLDNLFTGGLPTTIQPDASGVSGVATTAARSDHQHAIVADVAGAILIGDSASEGVSTSFARADHRHSLAAPAAPENVTKSAASAGASSSPARADHKHDITTGTPVSLGSANAEGTATSLARSDHVHRAPLIQTVFLEKTADTSTTSTIFTSFLSQAITTGANSLLIHFTASGAATTNARQITFRVSVDGTPVRSTAVYIKDANFVSTAGIVLKVAVTAASHTVLVEWKTSGGTASVLPVTSPDNHHASLLLQEVSV